MFWKMFSSFCYWFLWAAIWWSSDAIPNDLGYFGVIGYMCVASFLMVVFLMFWNAAVTSGDLYHEEACCPWVYLDRMSYMFLLFAFIGHMVVIQFDFMNIDLMTIFCLLMSFHVAKFFLWTIFAEDRSSVTGDITKALSETLRLKKDIDD